MKCLPFALGLLLLTAASAGAAPAAPVAASPFSVSSSFLASSSSPSPALAGHLSTAGGAGHARAVEVKRTRKARRVRRGARGVKATPFDAANCSRVPTRCAAVRTCAEARRALACGVTRLDPDHDGVPCEKVCG